jgi:hypothetical protein
MTYKGGKVRCLAPAPVCERVGGVPHTSLECELFVFQCLYMMVLSTVSGAGLKCEP